MKNKTELVKLSKKFLTPSGIDFARISVKMDTVLYIVQYNDLH